MSSYRYALAALALFGVATPVTAQQYFFGADRRAWLGFSYETDFDRRAGERHQTIVIRAIVEDSPADDAGLETGDTLVRINDINATEQLLSSLAFSLEPGDTVRLLVRRDGGERTLTVEAAEPRGDFEYVRVAPRRGILRFDADSLRDRLRVLIDSAQVSVDSLRIPNLYIEQGPGHRLRIYTDSTHDVHVFPFDSLGLALDSLGNRFRFFSDTAWYGRLDSLTAMWSDRPRVFELDRGPLIWHGDSLIMDNFMPRALDIRIDSLGGRLYLDQLRELDATPFGGITVWGARAIAGAELTELNEDLGEYFGADDGVLVVRVPGGSPAADAGLEAGDVIVTAGGRTVESIGDLRRAVIRAHGEPVRLEVIRRRERIEIELGR